METFAFCTAQSMASGHVDAPASYAAIATALAVGLGEGSVARGRLYCRVSPSTTGIDIMVRYSLPPEQSGFGAILWELCRQKKLPDLLCSYLEFGYGIYAVVTPGIDHVISVQLPLDLGDAERRHVLSAMESLFDVLAARRTDLFLRHLIGPRRGRSTPHLLDPGAADDSEAALQPADVWLVTELSDPEVLIGLDPSLVSFDAAELRRVGLLISNSLAPFAAGTIRVRIGELSVRVRLLYFPVVPDGMTADAILSLDTWIRSAVGTSSDTASRDVAITPTLAWALEGMACPAFLNQLCLTQTDFTIALLIAVVDRAVVALGPSARSIGVAGPPDAITTERLLRYYRAREVKAIPRTMMSDSGRVDVLIVLPGFVLDPESLYGRLLTIDLFGAMALSMPESAQPKGRLTVTGVSLVSRHGVLRFSESVGNTSLRIAVLPQLFRRCNGVVLEECSREMGNMSFQRLVDAWDLRIESLESPAGCITSDELRAAVVSGGTAAQDMAAGYAHVAVPPLWSAGNSPENLCSYLASLSPGTSHPALIDPGKGEFLDYESLIALGGQYAQWLSGFELKEGDVVTLASVDGIHSVAILIACLMGGWVLAPLNYLASPSSVHTMLRVMKPRIFLYDSDPAAVGAGNFLDAAHCTVLPVPLIEPDISCKPYPLAPVGWRAPAVMLFTSGSTGSPKAVLHSHGDLLTCSRNYASYVAQLDASDRVFTPSRLFFAYGLNSVMMSLLAGATQILSTLLARGTSHADIIDRYGVTVIFAVPAVYKLMLSTMTPGRRFPHVRLCISAGESLPAKLFHGLGRAFDGAIIDGIGATEVLSTFISSRPGASRPGCTGQVVPGFEVRLMNEKSDVCCIGEVGEAWVRGNTLANAYFDDDKSTSDVFEDGWFRTGDLFYMDHRYRFYSVGRQGHVLKVNGVWFSPRMMESVLLTHPLVTECAVCIVKDEYDLGRSKAFIVIDRLASGSVDHDALWGELRDLSRKTLGKDHYPHFFAIVEEIPRTSSGKLNMRALMTG